MTVRWKTAALIAVVLAISACGGGDGGRATTTLASSTGPAGTADSCEAPLPPETARLEAAARISTLDDQGNPSTLGLDAAAVLLDEMTDDGMCALQVSPEIREAIEAVRAASARGDRPEVRRLLEQMIRVDLRALRSPIKSIREIYGTSDLQKSLDAVAAAHEAYAQGEDDLGDEAWEAAGEFFTDYARDAIPAGDDVRVLLSIAREAQILGLDDVAMDAWDKARMIAEADLDAVADGYDPCTATRADFQQLVRAAMLVQVTGGDDSSGGLISKSIEVSIARANGDEHPDCEGERYALTMTLGVDTGQGVVDYRWDGEFTVVDGEVTGGGTGTVEGHGDCTVDASVVEVFDVSGNFTFGVDGTQSAGGAPERLTLLVDTTPADLALGVTNQACVGLADIAREFFSQVATFPLLYHPGGFDITVAEGRGTADVDMEPYVLHVDVHLRDG